MNIKTEDLQVKFEILKKKISDQKNDEVINECNLILKNNKIDAFYNLLCIAYSNKNNINKAISTMKEALKKNPKNVDFLNNIGMFYAKIYNYKEAENYYQEGLKINSNNLHILNNLANLKKSVDDTNEAIKIYKKILSIQSNALVALYNLAGLYNSLGNFEESIKLYYKILSVKPEFTEADRLISQMTKYNFDNKHFKQMSEKLKNKELDDDALIHLHFALGKAYGDQKKFKNSFENYKKANDISKEKTKYTFANDKEKIQKIKKNFLKITNTKISINKRQIIFIVGLPRSGTSLTEQILSSHKNVFGGGELPYVQKIYNNYFENSENSINKNLLLKCKNEYLNLINYFDDSQKVFTDKAPLNFLYIGFILKFLPNSKFINIIRNPMDNCWSMYKNYFATRLDFANNLNDLVNYFKLYKNMIDYWKKKFPNYIYDLSYEKLVNNSEQEIQELLKFCNLNWDENCLKHHENERVIKTISFNQARQPIYKTSIKSYNGYEDYLVELKDIIY